MTSNREDVSLVEGTRLHRPDTEGPSGIMNVVTKPQDSRTGTKGGFISLALALGEDDGFDLPGGVDLPRATERPDPARYGFDRPNRRA